MSLETKKPKELVTIVTYFMDDSKEGVKLGYDALALLLQLAEGEDAEVLPIRDDGTVLRTLPRAREGGYSIPKVTKPFDYETDVAEDTEGDEQ